MASCISDHVVRFTFLSRDFEMIENGSQSDQQNDNVTVTEDTKQENDAVNSTA